MAVVWFCIPVSLGSHAHKFDQERAAAGVISGSVKDAKDAAAHHAAGGTHANMAKKPFDVDPVGSVCIVIAITCFALAITCTYYITEAILERHSTQT